MHNGPPTTEMLAVTEGRCPLDTPLTEEEMNIFDTFYRDFLGKRMEDKLSLLKGMLLVRRGDLRPYVRYTVLFQGRYEDLIPVKQRDLLLSFPSVNKEVYNLIFSCAQNYGMAGQTAVLLTQDQVGEHLDRTEMFRIDLDSMLINVPSIIPEHKQVLEEFFSLSESEKFEKTLKFTLVMMADHVLLGILPSADKGSTTTIGQFREYLERQFGTAKLEENIIEFFAVGGGYIRGEDNKILLGGRSLIFDPLFADSTKPLSQLYSAQFSQLKFQLAQQIIRAEFPTQEVEIANVKPNA